MLKYREIDELPGVKIEYNFSEPEVYTELSSIIKDLFKKIDWKWKKVCFWIFSQEREIPTVLYSIEKRHEKRMRIFDLYKEVKSTGVGMIYVGYYPDYFINYRKIKRVPFTYLPGIFVHELFHPHDVDNGYLNRVLRAKKSVERMFKLKNPKILSSLCNAILDISANERAIGSGFHEELFSSYNFKLKEVPEEM